MAVEFAIAGAVAVVPAVAVAVAVAAVGVAAEHLIPTGARHHPVHGTQGKSAEAVVVEAGMDT